MSYEQAEYEYLNPPEPRYGEDYVESLLNRIDDLEAEINRLEERYDELKEDYERVSKANRG